MASFINTSYSYQSMFQEKPVKVSNSLQRVNEAAIISGGVKGVLPGEKPVNFDTGQPAPATSFARHMEGQEVLAGFQRRREREQEAAGREQAALLRIKNLAFTTCC